MGDFIVYTYQNDYCYNQEPITINTNDYPYLASGDSYQLRKNQINDILSLLANWDGYNGLPVFPEIGEMAYNLLTTLNDYELDQISDIYPNPNGTISFEWENTFNEKLSLELGKENFSYFVKYRNGSPKLVDETDIFTHIHELKQDIKQLFAKTNS